MLTKSPCGILLKLIYYWEKNTGKSIEGKELLKLINKMQQMDKTINIYNIHKSINQKELDNFNYWSDLSILNNSGRITIHCSEPTISITMMGSLTANTIEIPENIDIKFNEIIKLAN